MGLKYEELANALKSYYEKYGRGSDAYLAEQTGLDPNIIGRIRRGKTKFPSMETWDKLYDMFPSEIPPPQFDREYKKNPEYEATCPIMKTKAGCSALINPSKKDIQFAAYILDESMAPELKKGDMVIVNRRMKLSHGCLCYVVDIESHGRMAFVRRYLKYGDKVVLKAENPDTDDIVLSSEKISSSKILRVSHSFRVE